MKRKLLITLISIALLATACVNSMLTPTPTNETDQISTIVAATLSAVLSATPFPTLISIPSPTSSPKPGSDIKWLSVHDPILKITILYPESWILSSAGNGFIRIDASEGSKTSIPYTVQISQYYDPIKSDENLWDWVEQYDQISGLYDDPRAKISVREILDVNGLEAVYTLMSFPEVRFTDIRRENAVLFVWSNIGESADDIYASIYEQIVLSFTTD